MARNSSTFRYLENLWIHAGGDPGLARIMAAIALAESGGNPRAHNPSGATGLWQILGAVNPKDQSRLMDPLVNAHEAVLKYRDQGLHAWTTYTNGAYKQYMGLGKGGPPGYVRPTQKGASVTRVDQGVDYVQRAPYVAIASGTVVHIDPNFYRGTPAVYIKLDHPITVNGRTYDAVYYSETKALVRVGQHVRAGEAISAGGAAEIGFAALQRGSWLPAAHGSYTEGQSTVAGHDFLDVAQKNPNVQISMGTAPDMGSVTASRHQELGLTDNGLGAGFSSMPEDFGGQFGAQTSLNQEGAFGTSRGLPTLQELSPVQVTNIWQEISQAQNASPEARLLASNSQFLTQNTPDLLRA